VRPPSQEGWNLTDTSTMKEDITFEDLGLSKPLLDAVNSLGFEQPSQIQSLAIPRVLRGEDIVGLSVVTYS